MLPVRQWGTFSSRIYQTEKGAPPHVFPRLAIGMGDVCTSATYTRQASHDHPSRNDTRSVGAFP
jgi:hypothetical protein